MMRLRRRACATAALLLLGGATGAHAQARAAEPRVRQLLNDGWRFLARGEDYAWYPTTSDATWEHVSLPHTWNAHDPFDEVAGYRRGPSWYRRTLRLDDTLQGKRLFLYFEGANQRADVYVNGAFAGEHRGGYTAFAVDVTRLVQFDDEGNENLVAVMVDNAHDPLVPPLSVGYALYGGLYRDVWLVATDPVHLAVTDHAAPGVVVTTPELSRERGTVAVRGTVVNDAGTPKRLRVVNVLTDAAGARVAQASATLDVAAGARAEFRQTLPPVPAPHLWSPADPYRYRVTTEIHDGDALVDRVRTPLGFRWYRFDADSGFFLNGRRLALHGTNRHQDLAGQGSALTDAQHVRDLELIKAMGANFVRLAHYPQDPAVLDAADRLGLLVWEEIPVVNFITRRPAFTASAETMLREMIRQHANHPSVILWGIMNEPLLFGETGGRVRTHTDTAYVHAVRELAERLHAVAHAEDPTRRTVMAIHESEDYDRWGLADVTDVLGVNLYKGWYSGAFPDFGALLDARHRAHPAQVVLVSEYGAGSDQRLNSATPERFDFTGSWQRRYHERHLRQIAARPWLAGTAIWNEFDFSQPRKGYTIPNVNQKGMLTWDRRPKDVYYLYQANWSAEPVVRVASHDWAARIGTDSGAAPGAGPRPVCQLVDVYANLPRVELLLNGRSLGTRAPDDVHTASWQVPFTPGENVLEARGERDGATYADRVVVHFTYYPPVLADPSVPFRALGVNVGTTASFADGTGAPWAGDQPYRPGGFGYEGGTAQRTGAVITGTSRVPLLVTYREGLTGYRFDVPDGEYEVELLFAEPTATAAGQRVFGVAVNGAPVVERLDLAERAGRGGAVRLVAPAHAAGGDGVHVAFVPIVGRPILNAIHLRKR
ncbi:MAG TPA: glycoside hydrolase family 2 TIM barrel-domain containing protein [Gemmatimonadaceae bacterium]|nr:glycoside hydrolase family 2 TIM barrel-domain containing protein [Gemmatimonadaceae bacterium]